VRAPGLDGGNKDHNTLPPDKSKKLKLVGLEHPEARRIIADHLKEAVSRIQRPQPEGEVMDPAETQSLYSDIEKVIIGVLAGDLGYKEPTDKKGSRKRPKPEIKRIHALQQDIKRERSAIRNGHSRQRLEQLEKEEEQVKKEYAERDVQRQLTALAEAAAKKDMKAMAQVLNRFKNDPTNASSALYPVENPTTGKVATTAK
jgi:capsule polysaccharide export protein KpsE/RkpR